MHQTCHSSLAQNQYKWEKKISIFLKKICMTKENVKKNPFLFLEKNLYFDKFFKDKNLYFANF